MRSATVVLPVPGLPVKLMCSDGRVQARPSSRRRRSTTSSAAISRMRVLTGSSATRSASICASTRLDVAGGRRVGHDHGHARRPPLPVAVPRRPVAMPGGRIGRVGVDRVADLAVGLLLALDREARLDRRAPDHEGERRGLAPERAVVADDLHVPVRPRLARSADLAHDDVDVVLDEVELRRRPHLPQRVARVRVVGVLDHDRPALAQGVAQLGLDLRVGQVGQVGERSLGDPHGVPPMGPSSGWA